MELEEKEKRIVELTDKGLVGDKELTKIREDREALVSRIGIWSAAMMGNPVLSGISSAWLTPFLTHAGAQESRKALLQKFTEGNETDASSNSETNKEEKEQ